MTSACIVTESQLKWGYPVRAIYQSVVIELYELVVGLMTSDEYVHARHV